MTARIPVVIHVQNVLICSDNLQHVVHNGFNINTFFALHDQQIPIKISP